MKFFRNTGKVGPKTLRWDPEPGPLSRTWDPKTFGGAPGCDP